jgi:Cys-tRNA(Pro) deacylase
MLQAAKVEHSVATYAYVERGGTSASSAALEVDEHVIVKTLVFETDSRQPLIICQHGDRSVSAKALARVLGVRSVRPCDPQVAQRHTGYKVGGTSPFGTKKTLPVYVEEGILSLDKIYINAGARGVLVCISPRVLRDLLDPTAVQVSR